MQKLSRVSTRSVILAFAFVAGMSDGPGSSLAASPAKDAGLGCLNEMLLPTYSSVARRAGQGGVVHAQVQVGARGRASRVDTSGTEPDLREEVRIFLTEETTYRYDCSGKAIYLEFVFQLQGQIEQCPMVKVKFSPPNRFTISSAPRGIAVALK